MEIPSYSFSSAARGYYTSSPTNTPPVKSYALGYSLDFSQTSKKRTNSLWLYGNGTSVPCEMVPP